MHWLLILALLLIAKRVCVCVAGPPVHPRENTACPKLPYSGGSWVLQWCSPDRTQWLYKKQGSSKDLWSRHPDSSSTFRQVKVKLCHTTGAERVWWEWHSLKTSALSPEEKASVRIFSKELEMWAKMGTAYGQDTVSSDFDIQEAESSSEDSSDSEEEAAPPAVLKTAAQVHTPQQAAAQDVHMAEAEEEATTTTTQETEAQTDSEDGSISPSQIKQELFPDEPSTSQGTAAHKVTTSTPVQKRAARVYSPLPPEFVKTEPQSQVQVQQQVQQRPAAAQPQQQVQVQQQAQQQAAPAAAQPQQQQPAAAVQVPQVQVPRAPQAIPFSDTTAPEDVLSMRYYTNEWEPYWVIDKVAREQWMWFRPSSIMLLKNHGPQRMPTPVGAYTPIYTFEMGPTTYILRKTGWQSPMLIGECWYKWRACNMDRQYPVPNRPAAAWFEYAEVSTPLTALAQGTQCILLHSFIHTTLTHCTVSNPFLFLFPLQNYRE